jgi:rubrerythrin
MNLATELVEILNNHLKNEWKHHNFYLHNASNVVGLHCLEYKEFFLKQAASEMNHVSEFSDLIVGLRGTPTKESNFFPSLKDPINIIKYAIEMEEEVINNYVSLCKLIENSAPWLNKVESKYSESDFYWVVLFLEEQIQDSRKDRDLMVQMIGV